MKNAGKNLRRGLSFLLMVALSAGFTSPAMAGWSGPVMMPAGSHHCCGDNNMPACPMSQTGAEEPLADAHLTTSASFPSPDYNLTMLCCLPHSPVVPALANPGAAAWLAGLLEEAAGLRLPSLDPGGLFRPPRV